MLVERKSIMKSIKQAEPFNPWGDERGQLPQKLSYGSCSAPFSGRGQ